MLCLEEIRFGYEVPPVQAASFAAAKDAAPGDAAAAAPVPPHTLLERFSLTVPDGQTVALWGGSGCGKTTVARLLLGLEQPQSGRVVAPARISAVFQEDRLVENRSVQRNLLGVLPRGMRPAAAQLNALLAACGLEGLARRRVDALSGGQKRRVALLRAVLYGGDALILDEPFNGLDAASKAACARLIREAFLERGKPVLLITHIPEDAALLDAQIVRMPAPGTE